MDAITKKLTRFLFNVLFLFFVTPVVAQVNHTPSVQFKNFANVLDQVNMSFTFPDGFKEIKAVNTDNLPFDYAMEIPDQDFEVWFRINTQKENEKFLNDRNIHTSTDSVYVAIAQEQAAAFTSDKNSLIRNIPPYMLERYNADAGRTYLLNLDDSPITRHYKYALLIVLQKNRAGTVLATCFTNRKGPEFFKNMSQASNCVKFKQ